MRWSPGPFSQGTAATARPLVIPVFIPHEGCPHECIFCNQQRISGQMGPPVTAAAVGDIVRTWLDRIRPERRTTVQVAFYGGSFTALQERRQRELLAAVEPFRALGSVQEIRLSTRPDAIDATRLDMLRHYGVTTIELGVQSCDDRLLRLAGRGHTHTETTRACALINAAGFTLGLQLLLGLPGDTCASLRRTLARVIELRPSFVRLYPLLVLRGSPLERLYHRGGYRPLGLDRAVLLAAFLKKRFDDQGITVVRMGLQPGPELEQALVAGPYHPAFGELVLARLMLRRTRRILAAMPAGQRVVMVINDRDQSIFRGPRSLNIKRLKQLGLLDRITLHTDPNQPRQTVGVQVAG